MSNDTVCICHFATGKCPAHEFPHEIECPHNFVVEVVKPRFHPDFHQKRCTLCDFTLPVVFVTPPKDPT